MFSYLTSALAGPVEGDRAGIERGRSLYSGMSDQSRMELLEQEIATLHLALEQKGMNTKMTKDVFGRTFAVPVDDVRPHRAGQARGL